MNRQEFIDKLFLAAKSAGIEECEAYFEGGDDFEVDVMDGQIKSYTVSTSAGMCFRGLYAGKMGYASTEEMDDEAIDMLVSGVKENALLLETDDNETIFEGSPSYAGIDAFDEATTALSAAHKIDMALELEKKVKAQDARVQRTEACEVESAVREKRIVNSRGLDVSFRSAVIGAYAVPVVSDGKDVNFAMDVKIGFREDEVDIDTLAKNAVERAVAGLGAESIPSGSYRTVLRNDVATTVLSTFASVFSGESARKGSSLLKDKEGEKVASDVVTLIDDPLRKGGYASTPFDAEGVATFTKYVIEKGTLRTLLHNRTTAAQKGIQTTANASKQGYAGPVRVAPTNFFIEPSDKSFEELLADVGDGLLITGLMGMHSGANQISGDFSLGAKGFLIKNGRIDRPVNQITIAANFFELMKNIRAVASDLRFSGLGTTSIGSPALDVGMISVAGK